MSESLQQRWPEPSAPLEEHRKAMLEGVGVIRDNLLVEDDLRFETAYSVQISARGQKGSVGAEGNPGTGKTSLGDLMYGGEKRVEISRDDMDDTLFGYPNPINPEQFVPGKMKGLVASNPTAYLNEISHLANTGSLHRIWDLDVMEVGGVEVPLRDIAIYVTTNFPDGTPRVHELDEGLLSRLSVLMLTGDYSTEKAEAIQGFNATHEKDKSAAPILPVAATRRAIHEGVAREYMTDATTSNNVGRYIVGVLNGLNSSGLVAPINTGDARIGEALHDVARARLFYDGAKSGTSVDTRKIAEVAALVLPTVTKLSYTAKSNMREMAGRHITPLERAIAVRRIIARTAFTVLSEGEARTDNELQRIATEGVGKYSYANLEAIGLDVDKALADSRQVNKPEDNQDEANGRRNLLSWRRR